MLPPVLPQSPRGIRSEHAYLAGMASTGLSIASWITSLQAEPGKGIDRADRWGIFMVHPATSGCRASAGRR
ncbi:hypothetical protein AB0N14_15610 [Streptomyces sp. NPDC051104]|uniref:hypothetical protein n=1 Tax=Streptomyces sp. NPDC051104 TaxID=3155044 RepID=UPI00344A5200